MDVELFGVGKRHQFKSHPIHDARVYACINADSAKESRDRDEFTELALPDNQMPTYYADNIRDTATRVFMSLFLGYKGRELEMADRLTSKYKAGSTIAVEYGHSGGVSKTAGASKYLAIYDIGIRAFVADQGPGFGYYNNISKMQASYSAGLLDLTSLIGAALSWGFWAGDSTVRTYAADGRQGVLKTFLGDNHLQYGCPKGMDPNSNKIGNENSNLINRFLTNE